MNERFERLLALRGHPAKGLPASAWAANLGELDRDQVLRAVIEAARKLLLPEWDGLRPDDKRPHLAIDAAEAWIASKTPEAVANAKARGKDCTAARNEKPTSIRRLLALVDEALAIVGGESAPHGSK